MRNYRKIWPIFELCCSKTDDKRISVKETSIQQISDKNKKWKILSKSDRSEETFSRYECINTEEKALKRRNFR